MKQGMFVAVHEVMLKVTRAYWICCMHFLGLLVSGFHVQIYAEVIALCATVACRGCDLEAKRLSLEGTWVAVQGRASGAG